MIETGWADADLRRVEQNLRTDLLLGVSFVPLRRPKSALDRLGDSYREEVGRELESAGLRVVFGGGAATAALLFVRERPGAEEAAIGRPGVGESSAKLSQMIGAMKQERGSVHVTNLVRVHDPQQATVTPEDIERDAPWLQREIALLRPRCIVSMGPIVTAALTGEVIPDDPAMDGVRGVLRRCRVGDGEIPLMPTLAPEFLLANYTEDVRKLVWSDLQQVIRLMAGLSRS